MTDDGSTVSEGQGHGILTEDSPSPFPGPQQQKRGLGPGAIIGIVAGGVAVLVAVALGVIRISAVVGPAAATTPSAIVTSYLTAVSDGDAKTALSYIDSPLHNDTLLTDEVLAASNTRAPITGIKVTRESIDDYSADVTVRFLLGGSPVTASYSLYQGVSDNAWTLTGGLGTIYASDFDGMGLTVNGQVVEGDEVDVFPGTYELAITLPNFALSGKTTVTVIDPSDAVGTDSIQPVLSDAGSKQFRGLVRAAVDKCVASKTLTAGCGLGLPRTLGDGTRLVDGTIHRSLSADTRTTLDSLETRLSFENPTLAQSESIGPVKVTARCSRDGVTGTCELIATPSLGAASIDMAAAKPIVLWD